MKFKKIITLAVLASIFSFSHFALAKDGKIKVGVQSGPELTIAEAAKQVAKEKFNLDVELVVFTDYVTPNVALVNKLIDANAFQTKPFLESQAKDRGWKNLVILGNTFVYPIAAYSKKINNIAQIKEGATIAIPNDPTNTGRALLLLQAQGFIKLKDPTSLTQNVLDIVDNPKNLNIKTLDGSLIARALPEVDLAIINNTFAGQAGLFANRDAIFVEDKESPYVNLIVARDDNKDDVDLINFVKSYNSDPVNDKAMAEFHGSVIKGW